MKNMVKFLLMVSTITVLLHTLGCGGSSGDTKVTPTPDAPIISGIVNGSFNTNQDFIIEGADNATIEYTLDGGTNWNTYSTTVTLSDEDTYTIAARQTVDEKTSANTVTYVLTIDKTLPDAPVINDIITGSFKTNQSFTLTASESSVVYSTNGGSTWNTYTSAVTLSAEDTYIITAKQTDAAGNESANATPIEVTIDKTIPDAPVINDILTGSYNINKKFTISGEPDAVIEYKTHDADSWTTYTGEVTLNDEDIYKITARQADAAGNVSGNTAVINVLIDKTKPTAPDISGLTTGSFNTYQSFTLDGTESIKQYSLDGGNTWIDYTDSVTLADEDTYTVVARQYDAAGNESALSTSYAVIIDKTDPGNITGLKATTSNQKITLSWTEPADTDYAKVRITFTPDAAGVTQPIEVPKGITTAQIIPLTNGISYTFTVVAIDTASNDATGAQGTWRIIPDCVGEWLFNGDASDTSGYGHNGTASGATLTTDRFGNIDSAYYFGGNTINITASDASLPSGAGTRTISVWVKSTATYGNYLTYGSQSYTQANLLGADSGGIWFDPWGGGFANAAHPVVDGYWHHIVFTYDGTSGQFYIDLTNYPQGAKALNTVLSGTFYIGGGWNNNTLAGSVDDVRIYNRVLSIDEISALYHESGW